MARDTNNNSCVWAVCEMLQGMEGGWVVIEASHMMGYGLNVTFNMLTFNYTIYIILY